MLAAQGRRAIKVAVAHLLYYTGVLFLLQAIALRRKAVVLMYHRVLTDDERRRTGSHPGIVVSRDTFAQHMAVIKRRFRPLSVDAFADHLARRAAFESSSCLITFDDGWLDNFTHALPILRRHELPAVIFLPVNFIGGRRLFWREALTHSVSNAVTAARSDPSMAARLRDLLRPYRLDSVLAPVAADPRPAIIEAIAAQTQLRAAAAETLMSRLALELGVDADFPATPDAFIGWDHVQSMVEQSVVFGGHGAEHRPLAECERGEADAEILESRKVIERGAAGAVPVFSYPNGSFTPQVAGAVKAAGFTLAFTTRPGAVQCGDEPLALKRINIHEDMTDSPPMFLARLVGLF